MKYLKMRSRLVKLVTILNDGQYHDGTTLGEKLKMTRSAVWKAIKKLQLYGVQIDSIKGKGYALQEPLILLNRMIIQKQIPEAIDIEVMESVTSSNDYLKIYYNQPKPKICLAEEQVAGKGRLQRSWHSPFGRNIYLSLLYPFKLDVSQLSGLSLVVSLAITASFQMQTTSHPILVKWPNDVIYQGKKLAGILVELQTESYGTCTAIIGIGMNVNMLDDESQEIEQAWTSIRKISGEYIDRNQLVVNLINNLLKNLKRFEQTGFTGFMVDWQQVDALKGKKIKLKSVTQELSGIVMGVDALGQLIIKEPHKNKVSAYSAGEIQIIK